MPCYIELVYHPISQAAKLIINHDEFARHGSRMQKTLIGKPMNQWLEGITKGYIQWNGFLPELISETNEINFEIVFEGNNEDYCRFSEAVQRQADALSGNEFEKIDINPTFKEFFSEKQLQEEMRRLRKEWSVDVPTQDLLLQRDRLDAQLDMDLPMEQVITLIENYVRLIHPMLKNVNKADQDQLVVMRKKMEALLDREVR